MVFGFRLPFRRPRPSTIRPLRADAAEACAAIHKTGFAHPWSAGEFAEPAGEPDDARLRRARSRHRPPARLRAVAARRRRSGDPDRRGRSGPARPRRRPRPDARAPGARDAFGRAGDLPRGRSRQCRRGGALPPLRLPRRRPARGLLPPPGRPSRRRRSSCARTSRERRRTHPSSPAQRGRGTARSAVEGASLHSTSRLHASAEGRARLTAVLLAGLAARPLHRADARSPSPASRGRIARRAVPLPRSRGRTAPAPRSLGLLAAALFLLLLGPPRAFAQWRGWRAGTRRGAAGSSASPAPRSGSRCRVHGRPAAGRRLIVANHVSWLDILVLGSIEPMTFLAKKEVGAPALGGRLARLQGIIFVDRGRRRCIPSVNAEMARAMAEGEPVVLFAEATTGDGNRLLRFRSSHFEAVRQAATARRARRSSRCSSIIPASPACRSARRDRPLFAWYGDMTFFPHFRRFLAAGGTRCDVHYGAPIPVAAEFGPQDRSPAGPKPRFATSPPPPAAAIALFSPGRFVVERGSFGRRPRLPLTTSTEANSATTRRTPSPARRVFIKSFGCQMNVYDSQRMADVAGAGGLRGDGRASRTPTSSSSTPAISASAPRRRSIPSSASCANSRPSARAQGRRDHAGRRGLRRPGRRRGDLPPPAGGRFRRRAAELSPPAAAAARPRRAARRRSTPNSRSRTSSTICPPAGRRRSARAASAAFVTVQEGCDKFCSFCVVPYTRGGEASRPVAKVLDEIARLAAAGVARDHPARPERQRLSRARRRRRGARPGRRCSPPRRRFPAWCGCATPPRTRTT